MKFRGRITVLATLFAAGVSLAHAEDVSMAGGSVHFSTPSTWVGIMQVDGDPESRVFQVPDPSPSASTTLARVSVTLKQASNLQDFNAYVAAAVEKAKALPGYAPDKGNSEQANSFVYTANDGTIGYTYTERYWFRDGHVIQLRCVRPSSSQAGAAWSAGFDKGCSTLATSLSH